MRQSGSNRPLRTLGALAATGLAAVLALGGRSAGAGEPKPAGPKPTGNVKFEAHADPATVAPGGKGVVVIVGTIKKDVHVFSDKRFKVKPDPFAGVTYGTARASKHVVLGGPGTAGRARLGRLVRPGRSPAARHRSAPTQPFPLTVGAILTWSACDPEQCYGAESTLEPIVAEVQKDGAGASPPPDSPHPTGTTEIPMPAPGPAVAAPMPPTAAPAGGSPTSGPAKFEVHTVVKAADGAISVRATEREVVATFEPLAGLHMYAVGHVGVELPVNLAGVETGGASWGALVAPAVEDTEIHETYELAPAVHGRTPRRRRP